MKQISILWLSCMLILGIYGLSCSFVYGNAKENQQEEGIVDVRPTIEETNYVTKDHQLFLAKDCDVTFTFDFQQEKMKAMQVVINDEMYIEKHYATPKQKEEFTISTRIREGKIKQFVFQWLDEKEQQHSCHYDIVLDQEAPTITSFQLHDKVIDKNKDVYGKDEETIIVKAADGQYGSGVQKIHWYTVNQAGEKSEIKQENVNTKGEVMIPLTAPFEGYLYACAIDACENGKVEEDSRFYKSGKIHLYRTEDIQKATKIAFDCKEALKKDDLYIFSKKEVNLPLQVQASLDGIKKLEYFIFDEGHQCIQHQEINPCKEQITCEEDKPWKNVNTSILLQPKKGKQTIHVRLETKSGCVVEKDIDVCVDATNPKLTYTKTKPGLFIDEEQIVHLEVKEDHFNEKQEHLSFYINDEKQDIHWQYDEKKQGYMVDLICTQEGTYRLEGYVYDLANHKSNQLQDKFTIDVQNPSITYVAQEHRFTCSDMNLDPTQTRIQVKKDGKEVNRKPTIETKEKMQIFTFDDYEQWGDGYYTMDVFVNDLANHQTKRHYEVLKNTKGSTLNCNLKDEVYRQLEKVEITEENLSPIQKTSIFLSHKGKVKKLEKRDYQVQKKQDKPYIYVYELNQALFQDDGKYQMYVHSMDEANNQIDWYQQFELDRHSPKIAVVKENNKKQTVYVQDNDEVASVLIKVDGKTVAYEKQEEGYAFEAKNPKSIQIEVKDKAGNITKKEWKKTNEDSKQAWIPMVAVFAGLILIIVIVLKQKKCK